MSTLMQSAHIIKSWYERPAPIPTDFIGTKKFFLKATILEKREGVSLPFSTPHGCGGYALPVYFIFVMIKLGEDLRIEVSKELFDLLNQNDSIAICYRRGRWTGALQGKIAR